jgi:nucleoid-associated protein YgaU
VLPAPPANLRPAPVHDEASIVPTPRPDDGAKRQGGTPVPPPIDATPVPPLPVDPKPEPKPVTPGYPKTVKVKSGDSLWSIAEREYGARLARQMQAAIAAANPAVRPDALKVGTDLVLPAPEAASGGEPKADSKTQPAPPKPAPPKPKPAEKKPSKLPFVPQ